MRFLPVNLNALIVELDDLEQTLALLDSLNAHKIEGVKELIPAARTIMVLFRPEISSVSDIVGEISKRNLNVKSSDNEILMKIPVHYNGEDLIEVAQILGITPDEVIRLHTESEYTVAFTGFAPGFSYLTGGHPSLNVPRRSVPRTRIPEGAVGLGGTFSGIYPQASPGGWQIIGVTKARMWDLNRPVPAFLQPGFRVRFVDANTISEAEEKYLISVCPEIQQQTSMTPEIQKEKDPSLTPQTETSFKIEFSGIQTTLQDAGRLGKANIGVSSSGALDKTSLKTANFLVGNSLDTACLENVYGGLKLTCLGYAVIAVTGADTPVKIITSQGKEIEFTTYKPIALDPGDQLVLGTPRSGIRSYIAVRGGFNIPHVLDSLSTDTLANIGPAPITTGDILPIKPMKRGKTVEAAQERPYQLPASDDVVTLDVILGPRTDWFTKDSVKLLSSQLWQVTQQSNRVGIRLAGEIPLERFVKNELPSEGTSIGAIQVPTNGQPVLFLADHPLTGGYPVIGSVATYHLDLAGQIPVNAYIRFNPVTEFQDIKN